MTTDTLPDPAAQPPAEDETDPTVVEVPEDGSPEPAPADKVDAAPEEDPGAGEVVDDDASPAAGSRTDGGDDPAEDPAAGEPTLYQRLQSTLGEDLPDDEEQVKAISKAMTPERIKRLPPEARLAVRAALIAGKREGEALLQKVEQERTALAARERKLEERIEAFAKARQTDRRLTEGEEYEALAKLAAQDPAAVEDLDKKLEIMAARSAVKVLEPVAKKAQSDAKRDAWEAFKVENPELKETATLQEFAKVLKVVAPQGNATTEQMQTAMDTVRHRLAVRARKATDQRVRSARAASARATKRSTRGGGGDPTKNPIPQRIYDQGAKARHAWLEANPDKVPAYRRFQASRAR